MRYKPYRVYATSGDARDALLHLQRKGLDDIRVHVAKTPHERLSQAIEEVNADLILWSNRWLESLPEEEHKFMALYRTKLERGEVLIMIPRDYVIDSSDADINASEDGIAPSGDYSRTEKSEPSRRVRAVERFTQRTPRKPGFGVDQERGYGVRSEDPEEQTRK